MTLGSEIKVGPGLHALFYERLKLVSLRGLCVKGGQVVDTLSFVGWSQKGKTKDAIRFAWRFRFSRRPIEF